MVSSLVSAYMCIACYPSKLFPDGVSDNEKRQLEVLLKYTSPLTSTSDVIPLEVVVNSIFKANAHNVGKQNDQ